MQEQDPPDFTALNEQFYSSRPGDYFRQRLNLLGLSAGLPDALEGLVGSGFQWEELRFSLLDEEDSEERGRRRVSFVVTESEVLLHHAAEALIRLFLGHAGTPPCPWLEVSALRSFRKFRTQVERLRAGSWPEEHVENAVEVFLLGRPLNPDDRWADALDSAIRLIRLLASRLSRDANLYNSVKHGMTVIAATSGLHVLDESGRVLTGSDGPSVVFLESERHEKQVTWYEKTQWFNSRQAMWLAHLAVVEIEALWTVARHRYLGEPLVGVELVTREAIDAALRQFTGPGPITSFRKIVAQERIE